jgi:hypothetical protein
MLAEGKTTSVTSDRLLAAAFSSQNENVKEREIWGFHTAVAEDSRIPRCHPVWTAKQTYSLGQAVEEVAC